VIGSLRVIREGTLKMSVMLALDEWTWKWQVLVAKVLVTVVVALVGKEGVMLVSQETVVVVVVVIKRELNRDVKVILINGKNATNMLTKGNQPKTTSQMWHQRKQIVASLLLKVLAPVIRDPIIEI
jgi:uncharacterized membrane protein (DUF441 family)